MGLNSKYMDQLAVEMGYLYDKKIAENEVKELLTQVLLTPGQNARDMNYLAYNLSTRKRNTIKEVIDYYHYVETQKGIQGTDTTTTRRMVILCDVLGINRLLHIFQKRHVT